MLMFMVACFYLVSYFSLLLILCICRKNSHVKKKAIFLLTMVAGCAFAYIAFCIIPNHLWDLYRHFEEIDEIRQGGISYVMTSGKYTKDSILSELYMWFISFFPTNGYFQTFAIIIDVFIFSYIMLDSVEGEFISVNRVLFSVLILLSYSSILLIMSGVRNELASFIVCLAVYIDVYKEKGIKKVWLLYVCAVLVHLAVIPVIIVRICLELPKKYRKIYRIIFISWSFLGIAVGQVLMGVSNNILRTLGYKLVNSFEIHEKVWDFYICRFLMVMIVLLVVFSFIFQPYVDKEKKEKYKFFMQNYFLFTMGGIGSMQFLARMFYPIACIGIPYISDLLLPKKRKSNNSQIVLVMMMIIMMLDIYYQIRVIRRIELQNCQWIWELY